jgi:hypothetical protein
VTRTGYAALGIAGCFAAYLAYTTMAMAPDAPDVARGPEASQACEGAVRAQLPDARFPIDPSTTDVAGGRVRLEGVVDSGPESAPVRRNYECLVSATGGGYRADSVNVWQSH